MQTFDPVLIRGRTVWDRAVLPERLFADRLQRVRLGMAERGVDVLLVYGDVRRHGALAWLTNYLPRVRDAFLLLSRTEGEHLFVNVSARDVPAASSITPVATVTSFDHLDPEAKERMAAWWSPVAPGRRGLADVAGNLPTALWERLAPGQNLDGCTDATPWIDTLRFAKDPEELAAIGHAAAAASEALRAGLEGAEGAREIDVAASIEREGRRRGAEDVRLLLDGGDGFSRGATRSVEPGAGLAVYVALKWHRYWAEVGRTYRRTASGGWAEAGAASRGRVTELLADVRRATTAGALAALGAGAAGNRHPVVESIGLDPEERFPQDPGAPLPPRVALAVRWNAATAAGPDFWADTAALAGDGPRTLT